MKKTITFLFTILSFGYTTAQAPAIQWQKCFGGSSGEYPQSFQITSDGGYVLAGFSSSLSNNGNVTGNHGGFDYWVVKLDSTGTIQWQKCLGGSGIDYAYSIQTTSDGGYIVAGNSNLSDGDVTGNHGSSDLWIVKLDATGMIQWQKSLGGTLGERGSSIQLTTDGGYIVAGWSQSTDGDVTSNHGSIDCWIVKLDAAGTIQWQKSLGGSSDDYARAILSASDGGYIMSGQSTSTNGDVTGNHGSADYWVVKLDTTGTIQWQKSIGGSSDDNAMSIQTTSDGGYIVAGNSQSTNGDVTVNHGSTDYWVVKLDATGSIQWQKSFGGTGTDIANAIQTTTDGGYVVAGYSNSNDGNITGSHGNYDYWVVKLDPLGDIQWQKSMGGSGDDRATSILQTTDGGYAVAGYSESINGDIIGNHGFVDYWVVKLAPDALATPVFEMQAIVIYPNPVCNELQIQTPNNTTITKATILAINGQVVLEQTQNSNTINVENLAQGVYILEAYSDEEKYVSKFVKE